MFLPVTLDEAAAWLERNGVSGVTGRELLRLGAHGHLLISLPLSCRAYSPKKYAATPINRKEYGDDALQKKHDDAHVDLLGVYVVPAGTLFELEASGKARTKAFFGPDGEVFFYHRDVTINELRITSQELESFAKKLVRTDTQAAMVLQTYEPNAAMDYRIFTKIRSYCMLDLAEYIDTPEQRVGARVISTKLHGIEGTIADEGASARHIIEAYRDYTPRQHAAAVLYHFAVSEYLAAVGSTLAPPEKNQPEFLARLTRDALAEYAAFLPEREAAALLAVVPAPVTDTSKQADAPAGKNIDAGAGAKQVALPDGVPTAEIVTGFKLSDSWADKLRHIDKNPFLKTALIAPGSRHSATKKRASHLWNPVTFANIMIEREHKTFKAMAAIIEHRFPKWQDEWEAAQLVDESPEWDDGIEPA